MKRGPLSQFLALALLATVLVQAGSVEPAEAAFSAVPVGLETIGAKAAGLAWADFNEDGCLDVIVTTDNLSAPDQYNQLYQSDCSLPNPTFVNVTATHAPGLATAPLSPVAAHRQVAWGDVNNDGHLDFISQDTTRLSVWINKGPAGVPPYGFGDAGGNPVVLVDVPDLVSGFNMEGGGLIDYDGDGDLDIIMENNDFGIDLWDNDGTGTFTWWTPNGDPNGIGLPEAAAFGDYAAVTDFDVDGDVDFIGRKEATVDLWANTGGAFASGGFNVATLNANKGAVAFCDFDDDGLFDLIWTDHPATQVYRQSPVGTFTATGAPTVPGGSDIDGAACGDSDNDGDLDLFLTDTNGVDLLYPNTSTPGSISFGASTFAGGAGDGEGASFADYDNDGDLDILLSQNGAANELWRNDAVQTGAVDYLFVDVRQDLGAGLSRDALGATVQLYACDGVTALSGVREVNGGRGRGSQDPLSVHFGLPLGSDRAYLVRAQFPTGETTQTAVVPSSIAGYRQTSVTNATSDLSACQVGGTVFEDVDGNLLPGAESIGDAANPGRSGIDIRLYQDDGDGTPDGGDTLIDSAVTGAGGSYTLTAGMPVDYWVIADSGDVTPAAGGSGVAEQTFGPTGAICTNGDGPETQRILGAAGACYSGRRGDVADDFSIGANAEHIAGATGPSTSGLAFGFSFNVVTRTSDANTQGTLRRFLNNAITVTGANPMRFVPAVPTNASSGANNWWRTDVAAALPVISGAGTTVDGTAYDLNDGATAIDPNDANLGAVRSVGRTGSYTTPQLDPELEVHGTNAIAYGLDIQAGSAVVREISIWGFGDYLPAPVEAVIRVGVNAASSFAAPTIERNVVGTAPGAFVDPGAATRSGGHGLQLLGVDGGTLEDNLVGFTGYNTIELENDAASWNMLTNEIRSSGLSAGSGAERQGGIDIDGDSSGSLIQGNLFVNTAADAVENWEGPGGFTVEHNTIENTGQRGVENMAIRVFGTGTVIENNVFDGGSGPAIIVVGANSSAPWPAATGNRLSQNEFRNNAGNSIDLMAASTVVSEYDDGDGITVNDAATNATSGNIGLEYPAITSAVDSGASTTVAGTTCSSCRVEIYEALAGAGDTLAGTDYGEGDRYLGFATADGSGNWSFVDATVGLGDVLSAIAIDGVANTSEFSANATVTPVPTASISGKVFEDIVGDVLNDGVINDANNPGVVGATVRLYRDTNANGLPDGADMLVSTQVTGAGGDFTFSGLTTDTYWVAADSTTVSPSAGLDASYTATTPRAEQTYGPDGGWCADGLGATAERAGAGPCYGGRDGAAADIAATLAGSEHISRAVVGALGVANVDFGFSYNVVTNLQAAWAGSLDAPSYQGSLDQFLRNANAIAGANAMRFVPAVPTNAAGAGGNWWRIDYTGTLAGQTPVMSHDADTTVDGTAFDLADGATVRDTNGSYLGANAGGGVLVGVGDVPLPQVEKPELELMRSDSGIGAALPVDANAATTQSPDSFTLRDMAISGWVRSVWMAGVPGFRPAGVTIQDNVLGSGPDTFADPGVPGTVHGLYLRSTDGGSLSNNLIGFVENDGAVLADVTGWAISGNEVREAAQVTPGSDGINDGAGSTGNTISGNLIVGSGGFGLDGTTTGDTITNNTITGSGVLGVQTAGIRRTAGPNTISLNILTGNAGAGILVPTSDAGMRLTGNHFGGNGTIAIDLVALGGSDDSGDGISVNDGATPGTSGNIGLDYPIITDANDTGPSSTIAGTTCANCRVEVYTAVADGDGSDTLAGTDYGEGVTYLGFTTADGSGNWTYVDPSLSTGSVISTIAIDGANNTSEFSPNATVLPAQGISGVVFEDTIGDMLNDGVVGDANNPGAGNVTVDLYRDGGDGIPDGVDDGAPIATTTTDATPGPTLGDYSFGALPNGTYWVVADSKTVVPAAGVNSSPADDDDVWAEQTYAAAGGHDGAGYLAAAGPLFGGKTAAGADDASGLPTAEHINRVVVSGGNVGDVDFGFSFNVVTNLEAGDATDADGGADRVYQGSLRQFILNASAVAGANTLRFTPAVPTNGTDGGGNTWWRIDLSTVLPVVDDVFTTVDGTVYDSADGATVLDTNAAGVGSSLTVGVGGLFTTPQLDPELEIKGDDVILKGLELRPTADNSMVRNLAINRFQWWAIDLDGIAPDMLDSVTVENNLLGGTSPADMALDVASVMGTGVAGDDVANSTIRNNVIGYMSSTGIHLDYGSADNLVEGNEVRALNTGIYLKGSGAGQPARMTIRGNAFMEGGFWGIRTWNSFGDHTFTENTIQLGGPLGEGIELYGPNFTITRNIITGNGGDAISVDSSATGARISQNRFGNNGELAIDLFGFDGISVNDDLDGDPWLPNFPVIESAFVVGGNLTVTGLARPGDEIEFYEAIGAANDNNIDGDPHGEGIDYLFTAFEASAVAPVDGDGFTGSYSTTGYGTDSAAERFSFTIPMPAGLAIGEEISAVAIDGSDNTSEFGPNVTVVTGQDITGTVFEDIAGDVLNDGVIGDVLNPGTGTVTVRLYRDTGTGLPDATDIFLGSTSTSAAGAFAFTGQPPGTYFVTVDSKTVVPAAGVNSSPADDDDVWAEQTYGPAGSYDGGFSATAGAFYGGKTGNLADGPSSLPSAEHAARAVVAGAGVANLDFGFSFNVVTNLEAGDATDADGGADRVYQGSLRQFILNASAVAGANTLRFTPAVPTNATDGGGNTWWRIDLSTVLPVIDDVFTTVDGTVYDAADGSTVLDTNAQTLGYIGPVGTGPDGVAGTGDEPTLAGVAAPELEIAGPQGFNGFELIAGADDFTLENTSMWGFDTVLYMSDVTRPSVRSNIIGSGPGAIADPGVGNRTWNAAVRPVASSDGLVEANFLGFAGSTLVSLDPSPAGSGWTVRRNLVRDGGTIRAIATVWDGVQLGDDTLVEENLVINSGAHGIDGFRSDGPAIIRENTITGNGHGNGTPRQTAGIRLYGQDHTVERNLITGNVGPGISITGAYAPYPLITPAFQNRLSKNQFGGNGGIAIDLVASGVVEGDGEQGDGITLNDGATDLTHGNIAIDYPVIEVATIVAGTTTVAGTVCGSCEVEVYRAVSDGDFSDNTDPIGGTGADHGEGVEYVGSTVADGAGNWSLATTALISGDYVSAIAIDAVDNTSEFGTNVVVGVPALDVTKVDSLIGDLNLNGKVDPGDTVRYVVTMTNTGTGFLTGITFTDLLADPEISLYTGSLVISQGTVITGDTPGDTTVVVDVGSLAPGASATVRFHVQASTVAAPYVASISNQGTVASDQLPDTVTDDPADATSNSDPTVVALNHIPSLVDDGLAVDEDSGLTAVAAPGVLGNDTVHDGVDTVAIASGPSNGVANIAVNGSFDYTPNGDYFGADSFVYEVCDTDGDCRTATVDISIASVNDEPSFVSGVDVVVLEDSGAYSAPWAGSISVGPANESAQTGTFNITANTNPALFSALPAVDGSGGLTFTPAADANGFADVTIELRDDGGTANGGDDTSPGVTFTITVDPVNDPPIASDITVPVNESDPPGTILGTVPVADADLPPDTLTWTIVSGNTDGAFDIDPSTGDVLVLDNSPLDYELTPSYTLVVEVSDGNGGTDTATVTVNVFGARLSTTLTDALLIDADGDTVPSPGDTLRYTASITNSGIGDASGVLFTDLITDPSLKFLPGTVTTSQGSVLVGALPGDANVVVDVGTVIAGGMISVTYEVEIESSLLPGTSVVATQGVVSADSGAHLTDDPDSAPVFDPTVTPVSPAPLLSAQKAASLVVDADGDGVESPGDTLRFSIAIRNDGDAHAGAVTFRDALPDSNLELVVGTVVTSLGAVTSGNGVGDTSVEVAVGTLPGAGGVATVDFDAQLVSPFPTGVTEVSNQGAVSASNSSIVLTDDPAQPGAADPTLVPVTATPDVTAGKDDSLLVDGDGDGVAAPGDTIRYTVVLTNGGSSDAGGVTFTDDLPDPLLTLVAGSVTTSTGTIISGNEPGATGVTVDVGSLGGSGGAAIIAFDATVADSVPHGTTSVSNVGLVGATPTEDPDGGGPTITPLEAGPDLVVEKTDSGAGAAPGSTLAYTITYRNRGTEDASGVVLTETVPDHASYNAAAGGGAWSCGDGAPAGSVCTLPIGSVPTGSAGTAVFVVDVDGSIPAGVFAISNTVSVDAAGTDIDAANNSFTLVTSLGGALIAGSVWLDLDGDGGFDIGEPPLAGVAVELTHIASETVTLGVVAADGTFAFGGLASGDFLVAVVEATVPAGVIPAGGTVDSGVISVAAGQVWRADFPHVGAGSLGGTVWDDLDGDGVREAGEPGLGGVTVTAVASGHEWISTSDPSGAFSFEALPPDTYLIDVSAGGPADSAVTAGVLPLTVGLAPGINLNSLDIGYHAMSDLALAVNLFDAPNVGAPITYIFTVTNNGPADSGVLTVTALLPGGFGFTSATGTGWSCSFAGQLVCSGAPLASGASTTVAVTGTVTASEGVTLTILGGVGSTTPDSDLSNNQAALSAGVGQLPQTGINADTIGLYGLLLLVVGGFLLLLAILTDRRRREEEEPLGP